MNKNRKITTEFEKSGGVLKTSEMNELVFRVDKLRYMIRFDISAYMI